jgi:hypothetical protein
VSKPFTLLLTCTLSLPEIRQFRKTSLQSLPNNWEINA